MAKIQVYYGPGMGKTSAALGNAIRAASVGKSVYLIQFLKGQLDEDYFKRLEPEVKAFSFERSTHNFSELNEEEKKEEKDYEHLGAAGNRPRTAGKAHPAADCGSC